MTTLRGLMRQATRATRFRGHEMMPWQHLGDGSSATTECKHCKASVTVDVKPAPNGIDIAGRAVAVECEEAD
jgi:hypothetical protein